MAPKIPAPAEPSARFPVIAFRSRLSAWYGRHARQLPWRGVNDGYATWVSEVMLQQTRVATVIERYQEFLARFPTIADLAAADVDQVLALWSGLGYYRRARMLHRAAQLVVRELGGKLPRTAARLRLLPGVGDYTAAAIASLAFGERIAVLDGNVERVLLRILGEPEDPSAAARKRLAILAQQLVPPPAKPVQLAPPAKLGKRVSREGPAQPAAPAWINRPGDHNQAMMELGATLCLPRAPICLQCPVFEFCKTRGEHLTAERTPMKSKYVAHLLALRKTGVRTEVLLEQRPREASLMPGMLELPPLPADAVEGLEPALRLRHAITTTNYLVEVFTEPAGRSLQALVPAASRDLHWVVAERLIQQPLTGLARKVLLKLKIMDRGR